MDVERETIVGMPPPDPESLLARVDAIETLPVLSEHHQRLRSLVEDETTSLKDVVQLVERDPTFAANLIRIGNSPIFAQRVAVDTIQRAIQVIGFKGVADMSLTLEVVQGFGFPDNLDAALFWDHAVNAAVMSRDLARQNDIDHDKAYLVGLLHDVAFLVLPKFLPGVFAHLVHATEDGSSIHDACLQQFGCSPLLVTARLMRRWNFNEEVVDATEVLASPGRDASADACSLALAVRNAHEICEQYQEGCLAWDRLPPLSDAARLTSSKEHKFVGGISAAILSCC
ncbi:MAG: HDOD domain-containing protein [Myxococcales bacterium]|nr:HDOD domain-containing protein [Myxococcales bacterium]